MTGGGSADRCRSTAYSILNSFDGETGDVNDLRGKPEMNVASNGTQVGQVTSKAFTVYSTSGTLLATTTLSALVTGAGLNPTTSGGTPPYEAHVIFNPFIQRWIISVSCSLDCVLVSSGADAMTSTWKGFYLDNNGDDPAIHLGYDRNGVYLAEGVITGTASQDTPYASTGFAIPNSELAWTATVTLNPAHRNKTASKPLDLMTVIDDNPNKASGRSSVLHLAHVFRHELPEPRERELHVQMDHQLRDVVRHDVLVDQQSHVSMLRRVSAR